MPLPSRSSFYRLLTAVSSGRHTLGSARTRRSLAKQHENVFGQVSAARPGEVMEIDSTPLDVLVVHEDGTVDAVELTGIVDVATRTLSAAVLLPSTKPVDAALLLARAMTPEPMRPGWADALRMSRSMLPHTSLKALDHRFADAVALLVSDGFRHTFREDDHRRWSSSPPAGHAVQSAQPSVLEQDS
ncbi:hypothetical protein ACGFNX_30515 [Streptomyces sp. NPDC048723]|uniref:hypothetical protein n=1 Tax=Streptomyces sp. NPDC048723 TaxID=3365589 RepID=UPI0037136EF5